MVTIPVKLYVVFLKKYHIYHIFYFYYRSSISKQMFNRAFEILDVYQFFRFTSNVFIGKFNINKFDLLWQYFLLEANYYQNKGTYYIIFNNIIRCLRQLNREDINLKEWNSIKNMTRKHLKNATEDQKNIINSYIKYYEIKIKENE